MSDRLDWAITVRLKHLSFTTQTICHTPSPFVFLVQKVSFFYSPIALSPAEFFGRKGRGVSVEFCRLGFTLATEAKETKSVCPQNIRQRAAPKAYGLNIKVNRYFHLLVAWVATAGPPPPSIGSALYLRPQ